MTTKLAKRRPAVPYEPVRAQILKDWGTSKAYLRQSLKEGGLNAFLESLGHVGEGIGMTKLSRQTGLTRQALYKILYGKGRPQAHSLWQIVEGLNLRFDLVEDKKAA
jgi:probable addiction module antidote protein